MLDSDKNIILIFIIICSVLGNIPLILEVINFCWYNCSKKCFTIPLNTCYSKFQSKPKPKPNNPIIAISINIVTAEEVRSDNKLNIV